MDARRILSAMRAGLSPGPEALTWFAQGLASGAVTDAQAGAFAMAVCLNGLEPADRVALTLAMRDSGDVMDWPADLPVLDKHSTGGIGDCVSLVLAPALAECGASVPMISGRGLGHTGGTLDKLEAIPGLQVNLSPEALRAVLDAAGCVIASAGPDLAPADRKLYAVRDVTGTVQSVALITASILSKKLAAGLHGLVMDVKCGSGAFMKDLDTARELAQSLVTTATGAGCSSTALITPMDEPVSPSVGNALEVADCARVLTGAARGRLHDLTCALGGEVLAGAGLAASPDAGAAAMAEAIASGAAARRFDTMIAAMGGPEGFCASWQSHLPRAATVQEIRAPAPGYVAGYDGEALGLAVIDLGGGRKVAADSIDPTVGYGDVLPIGARAEEGTVLARVHAASAADADAAAQAFLDALHLSAAPAATPPLVLERITP